MAISPRSGERKPATRLSSVVLPQPDGPSSVISSPRRTCKDTSSSAAVSPKRLVTASSATATSSDVAAAAPGAEPSAGSLNVEHLSEAEEHGGKSQKHGREHDVQHRHRRHRWIGIFAHIVIERDRQGL